MKPFMTYLKVYVANYLIFATIGGVLSWIVSAEHDIAYHIAIIVLTVISSFATLDCMDKEAKEKESC